VQGKGAFGESDYHLPLGALPGGIQVAPWDIQKINPFIMGRRRESERGGNVTRRKSTHFMSAPRRRGTTEKERLGRGNEVTRESLQVVQKRKKVTSIG